MPCSTIALEFKDLQFVKGNRSLFAHPLSGEFTTGVLNILTGKNGSGKSTLLDVLALRVKPPCGGTIRWTGCERATDIAYLPQQLWDILDIRITDLLALAAWRYRDARPLTPPTTLIEILREPRKELGSLSGGQRQLLMFWLVSSQPGPVYIYDEPLRHLDAVAGQLVIDRIGNQVKQGKLVALSEHSLEKRWIVPCARIVLASNSQCDER